MSGLRGAVAFVLALEFVPDKVENDDCETNPTDYWLATTIAVIFFTVFLLGGTTALLVKLLGIKVEGEKMVCYVFTWILNILITCGSITQKSRQRIPKFLMIGKESKEIFCALCFCFLTFVPPFIRWIAPIFVRSSALDELIVDDGSLNKEDEIKAKLLSKISTSPDYPAHFHDGYHTEAPTLLRRINEASSEPSGYQTQ